MFFNFIESFAPLAPSLSLCFTVLFPFAIIASFLLASATLLDSSSILSGLILTWLSTLGACCELSPSVFETCGCVPLPLIPKSCLCSSVKSLSVNCPSASFSSNDSLSIISAGDILLSIPNKSLCLSVNSFSVSCPSASFSSSASLSIFATGSSPSFKFKPASVADGPPLPR